MPGFATEQRQPVQANQHKHRKPHGRGRETVKSLPPAAVFVYCVAPLRGLVSAPGVPPQPPGVIGMVLTPAPPLTLFDAYTVFGFEPHAL